MSVIKCDSAAGVIKQENNETRTFACGETSAGPRIVVCSRFRPRAVGAQPGHGDLCVVNGRKRFPVYPLFLPLTGSVRGGR